MSPYFISGTIDAYVHDSRHFRPNLAASTKRYGGITSLTSHGIYPCGRIRQMAFHVYKRNPRANGIVMIGSSIGCELQLLFGQRRHESADYRLLVGRLAKTWKLGRTRDNLGLQSRTSQRISVEMLLMPNGFSPT